MKAASKTDIRHRGRYENPRLLPGAGYRERGARCRGQGAAGRGRGAGRFRELNGGYSVSRER